MGHLGESAEMGDASANEAPGNQKIVREVDMAMCE